MRTIVQSQNIEPKTSVKSRDKKWVWSTNETFSKINLLRPSHHLSSINFFQNHSCHISNVIESTAWKRNDWKRNGMSLILSFLINLLIHKMYFDICNVKWIHLLSNKDLTIVRTLRNLSNLTTFIQMESNIWIESWWYSFTNYQCFTSIQNNFHFFQQQKYKGIN